MKRGIEVGNAGQTSTRMLLYLVVSLKKANNSLKPGLNCRRTRGTGFDWRDTIALLIHKKDGRSYKKPNTFSDASTPYSPFPSGFDLLDRLFLCRSIFLTHQRSIVHGISMAPAFLCYSPTLSQMCCWSTWEECCRPSSYYRWRLLFLYCNLAVLLS